MKYTVDEAIEYQKNKIRYHEKRLARATTEKEKAYSIAKLEYARRSLECWLELREKEEQKNEQG